MTSLPSGCSTSSLVQAVTTPHWLPPLPSAARPFSGRFGWSSIGSRRWQALTSEVVVPVAEEDWESDVEGMEHSIEHGWHPPPLLVSHRDGEYFLEGREPPLRDPAPQRQYHAWAILVFADEAERDQFLQESQSRQ